MTRLPDFIGRRAAIVHRADENTERLSRQLALLGLSVRVQWGPLDLAIHPADIVFVDADQGWSDLLPWDRPPSPVPLVALLQSEAPGRIAWALEHGIGALIAKPVAAASVYPSMVLAASIHAERRANAERTALLEERLRLRPLVHAAIRSVMASEGLDEERAYRALRLAAMQRRVTIEQVAAEVLAGVIKLPEAG